VGERGSEAVAPWRAELRATFARCRCISRPHSSRGRVAYGELEQPSARSSDGR